MDKRQREREKDGWKRAGCTDGTKPYVSKDAIIIIIIIVKSFKLAPFTLINLNSD